MNIFSLSKLIFQLHLHKIFKAFYLLTWIYFNDVNVGKNILIDSQLKGILFISSEKQKWNKTEKDGKKMEKENNTDKSDFIENEILDLNSLKHFEFESKANIGVTNSSSSDDEEEGIEYKVKRIGTSVGCECSTETIVGRCSSK